MQALEIDIAGLRAAHAATLPTLRMDYLETAAGTVTLDGTPLTDGEEQGFGGTVRLGIDGVGTLTLRSNRPHQAGREIEQAEEQRRTLLASLGVESLGEARQRQAAARDQAAELALARQRLADLAPHGVQQLHADVARLAALSVGELELKGDPEQARLAHAAAGQRVAASRDSAHAALPARSQADEAVMASETRVATLQIELAGAEAILGPEDEREEKQRKLAVEAALLREAHDAAEAAAARLRAAAHDLAAAEAVLRRTRSVQEMATQEAGRLREQLADLNGHIRTRSDDAVEEDWRETGEKLTVAAERVQRFETEIAVLDRLRTALVAARSAARDLYLKPVISELRPLLGLLFDDISIVFDENTLLPQTVRRNGQDEDVERLSGGMREQLVGADPPRLRPAARPRRPPGAGHPRRRAGLFRRRPHRAHVRRAPSSIARSADSRVFLPPARLFETGRQRVADAGLDPGPILTVAIKPAGRDPSSRTGA